MGFEDIEKYYYGQLSLLPEEEVRIRKEAEERGEDPDEAVKKEKARLAQATKALLRDRGEKIRKRHEKEFEKSDQ